MMNDGEAAAAANWSELHGDLLDHIVQKVRCCLSLTDYIRLGAVCTNWRWVLVRNYDDDEKDREMIKLPDQLPVLLIPTPSPSSPAIIAAQQQQEENDRLRLEPGRYYNPQDRLWVGQDLARLEIPTRTFYSLSTGTVHTEFQLRVPHFLNCRGSSHGWLIAVREDKEFSVRLLNPFRSVDNEFQLPPFIASGRYDFFLIKKAFVSANPSSVSNPSDLVVMLIYGISIYGVAFCRPGDASWTFLKCQMDCNFTDAIYYKNKFYAIHHHIYTSLVTAFDVSLFHRDYHPVPEIMKIADNPPCVPFPKSISFKRYLVESGGDLLQVRRYRDKYPDRGEHGYKTDHFHVSRFDSSSELNKKWVQINTLNGHSLFLGSNTSLSLLASDFHPPGCCKPNCIYFTDDLDTVFVSYPSLGPHDMGVFNMENGSFEPHYQMESKVIMPNAIWIQPMI